MKNTVGFAVFVLAVLGLLFAVSGKRYPRLPDDYLHRSITETTVCMDCHGPEKKSPLKNGHPPKHECFKCHKGRRNGR